MNTISYCNNEASNIVRNTFKESQCLLKKSIEKKNFLINKDSIKRLNLHNISSSIIETELSNKAVRNIIINFLEEAKNIPLADVIFSLCLVNEILPKKINGKRIGNETIVEETVKIASDENKNIVKHSLKKSNLDSSISTNFHSIKKDVIEIRNSIKFNFIINDLFYQNCNIKRNFLEGNYISSERGDIISSFEPSDSKTFSKVILNKDFFQIDDQEAFVKTNALLNSLKEKLKDETSEDKISLINERIKNLNRNSTDIYIYNDKTFYSKFRIKDINQSIKYYSQCCSYGMIDVQTMNKKFRNYFVANEINHVSSISYNVGVKLAEDLFKCLNSIGCILSCD
jgi:hypothetical protein